MLALLLRRRTVLLRGCVRGRVLRYCLFRGVLRRRCMPLGGVLRRSLPRRRAVPSRRARR